MRCARACHIHAHLERARAALSSSWMCDKRWSWSLRLADCQCNGQLALPSQGCDTNGSLHNRGKQGLLAVCQTLTLRPCPRFHDPFMQPRSSCRHLTCAAQTDRRHDTVPRTILSVLHLQCRHGNGDRCCAAAVGGQRGQRLPRRAGARGIRPRVLLRSGARAPRWSFRVCTLPSNTVAAVDYCSPSSDQPAMP